MKVYEQQRKEQLNHIEVYIVGMDWMKDDNGSVYIK